MKPRPPFPYGKKVCYTLLKKSASSLTHILKKHWSLLWPSKPPPPKKKFWYARLSPTFDKYCCSQSPNCWILHAFTKLAVSPLIMVRFEKFKIWHAQGSDVDLSDVTITSRATREMTSRAWRHSPKLDLATSHGWLSHNVVRGYLLNRVVDYALFLQANR